MMRRGSLATPRDEAGPADPLRLPRGLFYLACLTLPALSLRVAGESVTASDLLFALSAVAYVTLRPIEQHRPLGACQAAAYFVVLGGVFAGFRADLLGEHVLNVVRVLFVVLIWPWLAVGVLRTRRQVATAVGLWLVGSAAFAAVSIYQSIYMSTLFGSGRIPGLAEHVTDAGGILSIAIPTLLGAAVAVGSTRLRIAALVGLALTGIALVLSGSVSGFIVAGAGLLAVGIVQRRRLRILPVLTGLGLAWIALLAATNLQANHGLGISALSRIQSTTSGRYDTLSFRLATDEYAVGQIFHQPFVGRGLDHMSGLTVMDLQTHNMLLLAWFQGGLLFLIGLLIFTWGPARQAFRASRAEPLEQLMALAFFAASAFAMTSPLLSQRYIWFPAVMLIALAACESAAMPRSRTPSERRRRADPQVAGQP